LPFGDQTQLITTLLPLKIVFTPEVSDTLVLMSLTRLSPVSPGLVNGTKAQERGKNNWLVLGPKSKYCLFPLSDSTTIWPMGR
jgi:hypothetical protein